MGLFSVEDVTHWSIPVNNLEESEESYGGFLGLQHVGRLGNSRMICLKVAEPSILLAERNNPHNVAAQSEEQIHHPFTFSPDTLKLTCNLFLEREVGRDFHGGQSSPWKARDCREAKSVSSSSSTRLPTSGWRSISIRNQAEVPDVVWWPANIIEMNMPVTWSAV